MIDTHAHLMFRNLRSDLPAVLKRAHDAGITKIINVGCSVKDSEASFEMCQKYENIFGTLGIHPYDAEDVTDDLLNKFFDQARAEKKIVAIGETGLDYYKVKVDKETQKRAFIKQIELAEKLNLPVIIHCREAQNDTLEIIQKYPNVKFVHHCFPGPMWFAQKVWELGHMTSFTGVITYPKAENLRKLVKKAPLDKIMVETDCPFLTPQKYRGKRNEPAYATETAKEIAKQKNMSLEEIDKITSENSEKFFYNIST